MRDDARWQPQLSVDSACSPYTIEIEELKMTMTMKE